MHRAKVLIPVTVLMLLGVPAYAYADPSGGALFQVLMPTLAALWGMWMIFANKVRRILGNFVRKLRGMDVEQIPASDDPTVEEAVPPV